ncbi:heme-copper oxidase subunit III [Microcoleus sp. FACHB-68]|uniref:cytochrome c oxidase subunit 3 n=1 Tax=Microcoleus sp. FACHB-68 TaxID=2692826 RepID=UPI001682631F|nr:heme-copper oxidase subunit III [Microcoleus sp. FACHB-68]MBD1935917.1 heme-copper oxidase subunit III [Microcoleus sp. FACHB-68]
MQSPTIDPEKTALNYHHSTEATADHHEEHHDFRMWGVFVFLCAEGMIFFGLFAAYLIYKAMSPVWPPEGIERELLVPGINTVILISSSFVMNKGNTAIKKNDVAGLRLWAAVTALMGVVFLAGQVYEYSNLAFGLTTNLYASSFYVMTGFHGLHVCFGVILILGMLWRSRLPNHYSSENHFGVEAAEIYWHFVDVIWVILFVLLYLL